MFGKRLRLFNLLGFEVSIDFSWIIIALLIAWSLSTGLFPFRYEGLSNRTYWFMGIGGAIGLFLSIIVHEFAHSVVARKNGMPMKGITLFIFGGVAEMDEEPPNAKAEFSMAIIGPISSVVIGGIFYFIYRIGDPSLPQAASGVIGYLAMINVILAIFNMLPAFPLDGGRVLRSILWGIKKDLNWATKVASNIGAGFGILLIGLGIFNVLSGNFVGGMWWFLIGLFLHSAAKMSYQRLVTRRALQGEPISRFMNKNPVTVPPGTTVDDLVNDYVYKYHYKMFPVVQNGNQLSGCVSTSQIKEIPREEWPQKKVADIARACSQENTIGPKEDATEALAIMNRNNLSRLMVVDKNRLMGIITLKDMLQFLSLKIELE
ncbi:MAG: site-2 protease family protein [Deltaproteobacteria bacterium]|nr:site-2 protease family protein [Deltaproteobacteria bacterium]